MIHGHTQTTPTHPLLSPIARSLNTAHKKSPAQVGSTSQASKQADRVRVVIAASEAQNYFTFVQHVPCGAIS